MKRLIILMVLLLPILGHAPAMTRTVVLVGSPGITVKFTINNLKAYIKLKGIKHPEIVFAQSVLETGSFSSVIFLENHNLFGMKLAKKRHTTAIGISRGHAKYKTWQQSVDDYLLWQQMFVKTDISTSQKYYYLLGNGWIKGCSYAEDNDYVIKLKTIVYRNNLEENLTLNSSIATL
jgi:flagellum-specific peptidoglycan hydrolase FlgJ